MRLIKRESGQILIFVVILLALAALTIPPLLHMTGASQRTTEISKQEMQRFYAADTGMEDALHKMGNDTFFAELPQSPEDPPYISGNMTVNEYIVHYEISREAGSYRIMSYAKATTTSFTDLVTTVEASTPAFTLEIKINPPAGGSAPIAGNYTYRKNTVVSLQAVENEGYNWGNWTSDPVTDPNPVADPESADTYITMNDNYSIVANFEPEGVDYWLYINIYPEGNGTTSPLAGPMPPDPAFYHWYDSGNVTNLTATPANNCYRFIGWTGDDTTTIGNVTAAATTITMNGNYTITANFEMKQKHLTTIAKPSSGGQPAPEDASVDCGVRWPISANPCPGYEFLNWEGGPVDDPDSADTYIIMDNNYNLIANFQEEEDTSYPCLRYGIASTGGDVTINKTVKVEFSTDGDVYINGKMIVDIGAKINGNAYATVSITLRSGAEITGNAYANGGGVSLGKFSIVGGNAYAKGGNIQLGQDATIYGNATATGSITLGKDAQIMGTKTPSAPLGSFPQFPDNPGGSPAYWADLAAEYLADASPPKGSTPHIGNYVVPNGGSVDFEPGLHITGNLIVNNNAVITLGGAVYVDGYIDISPGCKIIGPGYLVAVGDITMWTNNDVPTSELPMIMSVNGNIYCKNNGLLNAVLVAPNGRVTLEENAQVYGAVLGKYVSTNNNFSVYYDERLDDDCPP